jgi:hypothetical protein
MDLQATEVTRWIEAGLSGLAVGNDYWCLSVQRPVGDDISGYFLSTEQNVRICGGIDALTLSGSLLILSLTSTAAEFLGLEECLLIDLKATGEVYDAFEEMAQMTGLAYAA